MLVVVSSLHPQIPSASPNPYFTYKYSSLFPKFQIKIPKNPSRFSLFARNGNDHNNNNNNDDLKKQKPNRKPKEEEEEEEEKANGGDDDRRSLFNFRLGNLLDPDPDNIIAVGLTGLLTWASAQVLWQLLLISVAILLAALKYSFIAALLIFIVITLL